MMGAQTTFKITEIPSDTKDNVRIFMASNLNGWKPDDSHFEFRKNEEGSYVLTIPSQSEKIEYKITQGNWDHSESDKDGNAVSNRIL